MSQTNDYPVYKYKSYKITNTHTLRSSKTYANTSKRANKIKINVNTNKALIIIYNKTNQLELSHESMHFKHLLCSFGKLNEKART